MCKRIGAFPGFLQTTWIIMSAPQHANRRGSTPSGRWKDILKIILSLVLIGFVVSKTNLQQIMGLKEYFSWPWIAASFGLFCLTTLLKAVQYWMLLGRSVSYRQTLKIVIIQNALTNFIANTAGIASYLAMFKMEQNVKMQRSGAIFLLTKAGDILGMAFFLALSSALIWPRVQALHELISLTLVGVAASVAVFWTALFWRQKFIRWLREISRGLRIERFGVVERGLLALESLSTQDAKFVFNMFLTGSLLSITYMTSTMLYFYSRTQSFQIPLDFWAVTFIAALMQFISIIPLQVFGGLGVTEVSLVYLYGLFGVTHDIPAILVGLRILFYLFNLVLFAYIPLDTFLGQIAGEKSTDS
jgi:hypothetical protein